MDVVALAAAGIDECVAPMGTALTETQIELLWRQVECPILCFDGDTAGQRAAMRAIGRALPMLKPAHSLRIVSLPQGLDPDDLVKQQGKAAMETLLGAGRGLSDALWLAERDAYPLATPEDKAGLKARLLAHVDTIGDQDIRSLYRRELLDRYSAFAFPQREPRSDFGRDFRRGVPLPARPSPANAQRLRHASQGGGRDGLSAAILAGLLRWPGEVPRHADTLARTPGLDARFGLLLDFCDATQALESAQLPTILASNGMSAPDASEYSGMRFGFLGDTASPEDAAEELSQAVELLVERPALERALAHATARLEQELSDEAYEEQQRLLKRKLEFERRLVQMAGRRGSASQGAVTQGA
jgi:DNA primase